MAAATSIAQPLVAPRMSIVVLPFANLSNDPEQQYFVDGITDDLTGIRAELASAYALKGETDRAFAELAEARKLSLDDRYSSVARLKAVVGYWGVPKIRDLFEATYFVGLRKAGMPEE
jgi:hypothetical protein